MKEHFTDIPKQEANPGASTREKQTHSAPFTAGGGEAENERLAEVRKRLREEILDQFEGNSSPFFSAREKSNGDKSIEQVDIHQMESSQAFGERFDAAWNLKALEMQIDYLAGKGEERTPAEEAELNRCMVWYSIYKKLYREADMRMRIADELHRQTRRSNQPYFSISPPRSPEVIKAVGAVHGKREEPARQA